MKFFPIALLSSLFLLSPQGHAKRRLFTLLCDRTPQVRDAIVAQLGMPCEQVRTRDLARIEFLDLSHRGIRALQLGDFDGLDKLVSLHLQQNELREISEGLFMPTYNLKELYLGQNPLGQLTSPSFNGLQNSLETLSVIKSDLSIFILQKFHYLRTLDLRFNRLSAQSVVLEELPRLEHILLPTNKFSNQAEAVARLRKSAAQNCEGQAHYLLK